MRENVSAAEVEPDAAPGRRFRASSRTLAGKARVGEDSEFSGAEIAETLRDRTAGPGTAARRAQSG